MPKLREFTGEHNPRVIFQSQLIKALRRLKVREGTWNKWLQNRCDITYGAAEGWLTGKSLPGAEKWFFLAQELGTTVMSLFFGIEGADSEEPQGPTKLTMLSNIVRRLDNRIKTAGFCAFGPGLFSFAPDGADCIMDTSSKVIVSESIYALSWMDKSEPMVRRITHLPKRMVLLSCDMDQTQSMYARLEGGKLVVFDAKNVPLGHCRILGKVACFLKFLDPALSPHRSMATRMHAVRKRGASTE